MHRQTHTPFFVNGLHHPRLPTHLECDTNLKGCGISSSKSRSGSCSSRVGVIDDANVAYVDQDDIEEDNLINTDDTIADSDEDDDAGIFSIANDYTSENKNTLPENEDDLLLVCTKHPATNQSESAEFFYCWHEKQWSVSCKTSSLMRWTGRNGTLKSME